MRRDAFKFWDLVRLILETLRYIFESTNCVHQIELCRFSRIIHITWIQSERYLLQQDKYHTCNNITVSNPFGFICLMNYQHSSYRKWPHFGDNNVSISASTRVERSLKGTAQPPQAALRVFMLKTSSASSDSKADPTMTTRLQWITTMPNIQCENTPEYT